MDLGIALRYVLEALKKQHGSKMYSFGIAALDRFKTRLKDYPQYCQFLASIPHFGQFPRHLREVRKYNNDARFLSVALKLFGHQFCISLVFYTIKIKIKILSKYMYRKPV
jgi:hypothetical protein